jgi:RimJ/RimL family protein N-acetyltransferase/catechol 2,3-dioxygenase-like lactoylglutathione lyase family enzyme
MMALMTGVPSLVTERLWLAPLAARHADDLHELFADGEALRYWHHGPMATVAETRHLVAAMIVNGAATWAFGELGSEVALGETGFVNGLEPEGHAGFGYALRRAAWGRGYTAEASRAALDWGFANVGIARAELWIHRQNLQSRRVAEKLGCTHRSETLMDHRGELAVRTVYGVTAAEWSGLRGPNAETGLRGPNAETGVADWSACYGIQPVLAVHDVGRAITWWTDVLGFRPGFTWGDPPTYGAVRPEPGWFGTTRIELSLTADGEAGAGAGRSTVAVTVADVDAVAHRARAAGATVLIPPTDYPWGQRQLELADPDGNRVRVVAPIVRPA